MTSLNLATVQVTSSGLTTATTAYTAGDILGAEGFLIIPGSKTDAIIEKITLLDEADVTGGVDIWFATAAFSLGSDNAAPSITDANARLIQGGLSLPAGVDLGGCRVATIDSLGFPVNAAVAATGVAFRLVTQTGHTFFAAATDIRVRFDLIIDT